MRRGDGIRASGVKATVRFFSSRNDRSEFEKSGGQTKMAYYHSSFL